MSPTTDKYSARMEAVRSRVLDWYQENARDYFPWRQQPVDPFHTLVFEMLVHQTFARKIVPVYLALVERYPTPESMARADVEEVRDTIRSLGFLYRADRLKAIGEKLVSNYGGTVPEGEQDLLSLPGVGPYTASAVQAFGFGKPVAIVDTNVLRIYRRVFSTGPHTTLRGPDKATVAVAKETLPKDRARDYNYALLDFAALQCTHYKPKCASCPLFNVCDYGKHHVEKDNSSTGVNVT